MTAKSKGKLTTHQEIMLLKIDTAFEVWRVRKASHIHSNLDAYRAGYLQGQNDLCQALQETPM